MGILRADRITGLGGANAIKGSVEFRARQNMRVEVVNNNADFNLGSGDFTIECWWNSGGDLSTDVDFVTLWNWSSNRQAWGMYYDADTGQFGFIGDTTGSGGSNISYTQAAGFEKNKWYHLAAVRISNTLTLYKNGTSIGSNSSYNYTIYENTADPLVIGGQLDGTSYDSKIMRGFISNLRIIKGEGIYTGNFTPPTNELTVTPNTVLLACQSPGNILQEATGKKLIAYRTSTNDSYPVASTFTPNSPVGFSTTSDVGSQYGTTFDGFGSFATSTYMVPTGGNTRERNRGRGIYGLGGFPSYVNNIDFLTIQSTGNAQDFGDLTEAASFMGAAGNQTRSVFSRRYNASGGNNTMDFVTIANTANAIDFGDATTTAHAPAGCGNNTRGLFGGGATTNILEFITFATAGNAQDFGDLYSKRDMGGLSNSTRGVFAGGGDAPQVNTIQFVTISTTGNGSDFGDLTQETQGLTGSSNSTRGIFAGGYTPTMQNTIQFITIATTGNATDFGDLTFTSFRGASCSSSTRSVIMRGWSSGGNVNDICFITISTSGNAQDFGDKTSASGQMSESGTSDCHGGLE